MPAGLALAGTAHRLASAHVPVLTPCPPCFPPFLTCSPDFAWREEMRKDEDQENSFLKDRARASRGALWGRARSRRMPSDSRPESGPACTSQYLPAHGSCVSACALHASVLCSLAYSKTNHLF